MKYDQKQNEVTKLGRGRRRRSVRLDTDTLRMLRVFSMRMGVTLTDAFEAITSGTPLATLKKLK